MVNADLNEIGKFDDRAHNWWDAGSDEFKTLHDINPLRLDWIDRHTVLSGKKVVDVGCGGGILSESMSARGAEVTGIDLSEKALAVARLHLLESGLHVDYHRTSAEEFALQHPAQFDVVTCMELLEHVPDPASTVEACAKLVRPGGQIFLSTLNRNPKAYLLAVIAAEYIMGMLPRGTHDYAKFLRPSELKRACCNAGLEVREITGFGYNPLKQNYRLTANTDVNYLLLAVRPE